MFDEKFIMTSWYHHGKKKIQRFDNLECVCEPTNKHDPTAVKIMKNGVKVGYIPKIYSASATSVLDSGGVLHVVVLADSIPKDDQPPMLRVYDDEGLEASYEQARVSQSESASDSWTCAGCAFLMLIALIAMVSTLSSCVSAG